MSKFRLLLRNLRHFAGVNLAVIAGMAVATAVLTGALMVGDSVRASLADLALQRLGALDDSLISIRFFDQTLVDRLRAANQPANVGEISAAILIRGGAMEEQARLRTADVQIAAIANPTGKSSVFAKDLPARGTCILNGQLADAIGAHVGSSILFSVATQSDLPREAALSQRSRSETLASLRATVSRVERQSGFLSLFNPNGSQRVPRNAWVNMQDLAEMIEQDGRTNAIFVNVKANGASTAEALNQQLEKIVGLEDYGLSFSPVADAEVSVFSRETYLAPPVVDAARRAAQALQIKLRAVSVNLLTVVRNQSSPEEKSIHYAVGAGIDDVNGLALAENQVAINQWTADQLGAKVGDKLSVDFYARQEEGNLTDASKILPPEKLVFEVAAVIPMSGIGADPKLPPNYKGLTDARSVADWNPPEGLVIDKKLVTRADEDYWEKYRAAPKVFLSLRAAQKLWGGAYGAITGLRVPSDWRDRFAAELLAQLKPRSMGLVFQPIKAQQLAAARGGTDFSEFFLLFSFFLIVAAAMLVAMLFRLNVEQRARQLGLLGAMGFSAKTLRRITLFEGMILAIVGGAIGLAGAIGYTWLIMAGLRTWWIGAVGTTAMRLYIVPATLANGLVASLFVAFFAILWAVWRMGRTSPARLLAGAWNLPTLKRGDGRVTRWIGILLGIAGVGTIVTAAAGKLSPEKGFGGGALLLVGVLCWLAGALRPRRASRRTGFQPVINPNDRLEACPTTMRSIARLGVRNASRHTARGVLAVGLIGFAAFTLITVAAMRQTGVADPDRRDSETGGYRLILSADNPLLGDLNTVEGRKTLGMRDPQSPVFRGVRFTSLRMWAGQDISCLNLTKPASPTILGVPPQMISRGGFIKGAAIENASNVWLLLDSNQGDEIPIIADADTQEYVLQMKLGDTLPLTDQLGVHRKLKLVGTIAHSIFQGQLLMSDANFRRLFPGQNGFGMVLAEVPHGAPATSVQELQWLLASELDEYSVSIDNTADRLKAYQNVQNTYLSTFQTLGALGLMLGTLGLAVVLVRTVIERRSELALLASLGFSAAARVRLVLAENAFLLVLGLLAGSVCAVLGIIPAITNSARSINVAGLALTLALVLAVGLLASAAAVHLSGVATTAADLRRE